MRKFVISAAVAAATFTSSGANAACEKMDEVVAVTGDGETLRKELHQDRVA